MNFEEGGLCCSLIPCDAAEAEWAFYETGGKMFERSEFFSARKMPAQRRAPQELGAGAPFSAYSFLTRKKSRTSGGGVTPRSCSLCSGIENTATRKSINRPVLPVQARYFS